MSHVPFPPTQNDTSAHATSDPALRLTADLSRDDLSDEQRHETLTKLLEEVVALKLVSGRITVHVA